MKKMVWSTLGILFLLFLIPNAAFAHTGLKSSDPENNQIVTEALKEITMEFNTDIEPLSKFEVVDDAGTAYKVSNIKVNKSQMVGTMEEPLNNGVYTVNWKIIGRDGHPIKGTHSFKIEISPSETPSLAPTETEPSASSSPSEAVASGSQSPVASSQAPQPQTAPDSSEDTSLEASSNASWIFLGLAAVVLVAFVAIALVRRKKG